ncbi:MAG: hypothetical protein WA957_09215 [Alteraurantiacibacter sp.]
MKITNTTSFRLAHPEDVPKLSILNVKFLQENLTEIQRRDGFLTCEPFSQRDFIEMVDREDIILVEDGEKAVGYYLADNSSQTKTREEISNIASHLAASGILPKSRLALRIQVVIEPSYRRQKVYWDLTNFFFKQVSLKYDVAFAIVYKSNPKITAHLRVGWKIVKEDSEKYFLTYSIRDRHLDSGILP